MTPSDRLRLRLTPLARADLEQIWSYSARTWSVKQADRYIDALTAAFDTLCTMPEMGREYREFKPPVRVHPVGQHVIIYCTEADVLLVIRMLGGRQNWRTMLDAIDR